MSDQIQGDDAAPETVAPVQRDRKGRPVKMIAAPTRGERFGRWTSAVVAMLFGLIYAYYLWDAIRSMIELPAQYEDAGLTRADAPWALLVAGVIIPVVVYVATYILGRKRGVFPQVLIFLVGLGLVACLSLGVIALG